MWRRWRHWWIVYQCYMIKIILYSWCISLRVTIATLLFNLNELNPLDSAYFHFQIDIPYGSVVYLSDICFISKNCMIYQVMAVIYVGNDAYNAVGLPITNLWVSCNAVSSVILSEKSILFEVHSRHLDQFLLYIPLIAIVLVQFLKDVFIHIFMRFFRESLNSFRCLLVVGMILACISVYW